jgi:organic hydroperoxide reductase OsmC/OhrA
MPQNDHRYQVTVRWTGNKGNGTSSYRSYGREHEVSAAGKVTLPGSADPSFRGDPERWNPEELLVAALAQCHMLAYLYLCAVNGVGVLAYDDDAEGTMTTSGSGGRFSEVTLHPRVTVASRDMIDAANELHRDAHADCFIASSVNFPVHHEPTARATPPTTG